MQFSEELVNQVVANVLSPLSRQGQVAQHTGAAASDASVVLTEKVITADLLSAKVKGQAAVGIVAGAILTPTAKDYIRQNQISVHRASTSSASTQQRSQWRAIVLTHSSSVENALTDIEQQTGSRWSQELSTSLDHAVQDATSSLCRADAAGVVLFASAAEKAACLANRNQKVRGAAVQDVNHLQDVISQMSPNLICVNPKQKSFIELRNLVKTFVKAGIPQGN